MKNEWRVRILIGVFVAALIMGAGTLLPLSAAGGPLSAWLGLSSNAPLAGSTVSGDYEGSVTLQGVYAGVYNITPTTQITLDGNIDLSLHLEQNGTVASGFVLLDRTLVFTKEATIMVTPVGPTPVPPTPAPTPHALGIGPQVHGTFNGAALYLESDPSSISMNGRTITRRFSLNSNSIADNGATLVGTYRETIWGYAMEPSTVVGTFTLRRPIYGLNSQISPRIYLPIITKT